MLVPFLSYNTYPEKGTNPYRALSAKATAAIAPAKQIPVSTAATSTPRRFPQAPSRNYAPSASSRSPICWAFTEGCRSGAWSFTR